jgi:hypothetical protein
MVVSARATTHVRKRPRNIGSVLDPVESGDTLHQLE